jgi:hypothetical protein
MNPTLLTKLQMCGDGSASGGNHPPMRHRQINDKCISIETNAGCRFQQFVFKISVVDVQFAVFGGTIEISAPGHNKLILNLGTTGYFGPAAA